ncbi:MAG: DUF4097 family beta strand repeat-containing protein [Leuconostoc carnosum]|uniref:DUF4097 family beta strand repeat-containing protein n=1 Tax=Leuconostoc carnosum TaxID=1252 RepID=UPI003F96B5A6
MTSIEMEIRTRLDVLFSQYTPNNQLTEFKEELVADLLEAYQDFAKQDRSHDEALDDAFDQLGDIESVLSDISQQHTSDEHQSKSNQNKKPFVDFSDDGVHIGNLHINGKGVRLGDDIVIDGKNDKVNLGDWLHVDHDGARIGRKYYKFDDNDNNEESMFDSGNFKMPSWAAAHHNAQIPISTQSLIFDYKDATVHFYTNDKLDLITLDEYFSRDNSRYFATIHETDDHISVTQGDSPLIFHVRKLINIGLPKSITNSDITIINRNGNILVQDITLANFNVNIESGNFKAQHIQAKHADWQAHSGNIQADHILFETAKIDSRSGHTKLDHTTINQAQIDLSSGSTDINHFAGGGKIKVNSGSVRLRINKLTSDLKLKTSSGRVRITTPETQDFYFDLNSNSGSIKIERTDSSHLDKDTSNYKRGFFGDDPRFTIDATTNSGTIKVY